ncbi:MAG: phosphate ABC transporter permease subunit PstC [Acidobacteria bacterium]|nr:phosphate ABC transporter permease subunit PstC [Acidobacteriota bacterium]MDW7984991.1 phosphate ABC transporter permease subunit PstC [Acidobacteriota bacterium]
MHVRVEDVPRRVAVRRRRWGEKLLEGCLAVCASVAVLTTAGIVAVLIFETAAFFRVVSIWEFLTDTQWTPLFVEKHFGILPLATGTLLTTGIALSVALPVGILAAIYLSEYCPEGLRRALKPALEVLAGIPTVVYGYFALLFVTPLLRQFIPSIAGLNALSAGLVMGVMIIPTIASLSDDALYVVPRSLREAAYALGASRRQVVLGVVVPAARSGILSALLLGISRAIGETMIVAIAAGMNPRLTLNPLVPIETMTAYIVQVSLGDTPTGSIEFRTIFAVGFALFLATLVFNVFSYAYARRFRETYR